jgi:flagella basal body P-ring formation protein FlgA
VYRPIIHAGDRLLVEERTATVEAHLEAVALGPASEGEPLRVRLLLGGKTMEARALGPGRAVIKASGAPSAEPGAEVRR